MSQSPPQITFALQDGPVAAERYPLLTYGERHVPLHQASIPVSPSTWLGRNFSGSMPAGIRKGAPEAVGLSCKGRANRAASRLREISSSTRLLWADHRAMASSMSDKYLFCIFDDSAHLRRIIAQIGKMSDKKISTKERIGMVAVHETDRIRWWMVGTTDAYAGSTGFWFWCTAHPRKLCCKLQILKALTTYYFSRWSTRPPQVLSPHVFSQ